MMSKKKVKPSEYPDLILKALYQRYRQTGETKIETLELQQLGGVPNNGLYNALEILKKRGQIEEGLEGQPYFSYITSDGTHHIVTLSAEGIKMGQYLTRPCHSKAWDCMTRPVPLALTILGIIVTLISIILSLR